MTHRKLVEDLLESSHVAANHQQSDIEQQNSIESLPGAAPFMSTEEISKKESTRNQGRMRISQLGSSGLCSKYCSTTLIADLEREIPVA